jgi:peroxiredoxin
LGRGSVGSQVPYNPWLWTPRIDWRLSSKRIFFPPPRLSNRVSRRSGPAGHDQVDEAESQAAGEHGVPRGTLTITAPIAFGRLHVVPVVNAFLAEFPQINISLTLSDHTLDVVDDLVSSGIAERAIHAGDYAPEFRLRDPDGKTISSYAVLNSGPVLVVFYRGGWCPYCKLDLRAIQAVARQLHSSGASIIAVSQQSANESRSTERMNGLSFPNLVDRGGKVARAFGLRWKLSRELRATEIECGLDLAAVNGESSWTLTMPARYVISPEGIVEYADISADYTRRCDPTELLPVLSQIRTRLAH